MQIVFGLIPNLMQLRLSEKFNEENAVVRCLFTVPILFVSGLRGYSQFFFRIKVFESRYNFTVTYSNHKILSGKNKMNSSKHLETKCWEDEMTGNV